MKISIGNKNSNSSSANGSPAGSTSTNPVNGSSTAAKQLNVKLGKSATSGQSPSNNTTIKLNNNSNSNSNSNSVGPVQNRGYRVATDYDMKDLRSQIYTRPDSYIRSAEKNPRNVRILNISDPNNPQLQYVDTDLPLGVESCFDEILANAADAIEYSRQGGHTPSGCNIVMDSTSVTMWNDGSIPIEMHPTHGMMVPEMTFGVLLSSSNYDDTEKRSLRGRNGFGAKLANIFSHKFSIDIGNSRNAKRYQQTWEKNMTIKHDPIITDYEGVDYVQVSYDFDHQRFGYTEFPEVAFHLFARMALEASFTSKEKVVFNGISLDYPLIENYAKLFNYVNKDQQPIEAGKLPNHVVSYNWHGSIEVTPKKGTMYPVNPRSMPDLEMIVLDTPYNGTMISFVNGAECVNGGVHVNDALKAVCDVVIKDINDKIINANGKDKDNANKIGNLTIKDVKEHLTIIITLRVDKPVFEDQTKTKFSKPRPKIEIDPKLLKKVNNWELAEVLYDDVQRRQFDKMNRGKSGKKRRKHGGAKATRANKAGGSESLKCTAFLVEGDSASSFPEKFIKFLGPTARDYYGTFVLGGKPLNTRNANIFKIAANKVIQDLFDFLGIQEGIDYTKPENRKKLNYGRVIILTDADADGWHISGLITGNLDDRARTLLQAYGINQAVPGDELNGLYLHTMFTRYIVLDNGMSFRTEEDYELWKQQDPRNSKVKGKYLKGLGTNRNKDIEMEAKDPCIMGLEYDQYAHEALELAFNGKYTNPRKEWIKQYKLVPGLCQHPRMPISTYVHTQVIKHPKDNVARMIPKMMDMLKESQRKILWAALNKFKWGNKNTSIKVSQLASHVAEVTDYHHGDGLAKVVTWMAQDIIGRNNLPLLIPDGQFGTRTKLGKKNNAASPRYIFTALDPLTPLIFRKEDLPILNLLESDGQEVEPDFMLPVIKLLGNVTRGIGTGWSTFIPCYNPLDEAMWLMCRLSGNKVCEMIPWYRGFKGMLIVKPRDKGRKKKKKVVEEDEEDKEDQDKEENDEDEEEKDAQDLLQEEQVKEENFIDANTKLTLETQGIFDYTKEGYIHITELPIGVGTKNYEEMLDKMEEDDIITSWTSYSDDEKIDIRVYGFGKIKNKPVNLKNLKLTASFGMSNFYLLDRNGIPKHYDNVHEIMEEFFHIRLSYYLKRKEWIIDDMNKRISILNYRIKYLYLLKDKIIETAGVDKDTLKELLMVSYQIPWEHVKTTTHGQSTKQGIEKLEKQVQDIITERDIMVATSPEQLWMNDLKEFVAAYCKQYKCEMPKYQPRTEKVNGYLCRHGEGPVLIMNDIKSNGESQPVVNISKITRNGHNIVPDPASPSKLKIAVNNSSPTTTNTNNTNNTVSDPSSPNKLKIAVNGNTSPAPANSTGLKIKIK